MGKLHGKSPQKTVKIYKRLLCFKEQIPSNPRGVNHGRITKTYFGSVPFNGKIKLYMANITSAFSLPLSF